MKRKWKVWPLAIIAALPVLLGAGCGGFETTQSVSPATFLLPGIMRADPPQTNQAPAGLIQSAPQIARVR